MGLTSYSPQDITKGEIRLDRQGQCPYVYKSFKKCFHAYMEVVQVPSPGRVSLLLRPFKALNGVRLETPPLLIKKNRFDHLQTKVQILYFSSDPPKPTRFPYFPSPLLKILSKYPPHSPTQNLLETIEFYLGDIYLRKVCIWWLSYIIVAKVFP